MFRLLVFQVVISLSNIKNSSHLRILSQVGTRFLTKNVLKYFIDIGFSRAYNNLTRQATACVCRSVEIRECAGTHCLMELAGGVVQRNLKPV